MHLDNYDMGRIEIDGRRYETDLLIVGGKVDPSWWRQTSHVLAVEDLTAVTAARAKTLIVGKGKYGKLDIPSETRTYLAAQGIELEDYDTARACERFNELSQTTGDVAAALHLTC